MRSIATLMGVEIAVPDFSTLSRRGKGLALPPVQRPTASRGPVHLVVDSTGLKVFGEGEWLENKHKIKVKRKRWRKLHLGLDLVSGGIIFSELTTDDVGDPTALPDLLDQIDGCVESFIADGAYDGSPSRDLLAMRLGEIVEVIIPPPRRQFEVRNRRAIQRFEIATSPKSKPMAGSHGRNLPAIIDAAGLKPRWADGRL